MSRPPYSTYPYHHPHHGRPIIVVSDHDILCGRGVNIAQHPGNERFRALVNTRHDESYCTAYTTSEKRAVAEEILKHIKSLNPPGRFLKRSGRSHSSRGLNGPWEELSDREAVKKTCQALRDCNRTDRSGYAASVRVPEDVRQNVEQRSGLTNKQHAAVAVAAATSNKAGCVDRTGLHNMKRTRTDDPIPVGDRSVSVSPTVDHPAEWLKKQRIDDTNITPPAGTATGAPAIVTTSPVVHGVNILPADSLLSYAAPTTAPSPMPADTTTTASVSCHSRSISPVVASIPSTTAIYNHQQTAPSASIYVHPAQTSHTDFMAISQSLHGENTHHYPHYSIVMGNTPGTSDLKLHGGILDQQFQEAADVAAALDQPLHHQPIISGHHQQLHGNASGASTSCQQTTPSPTAFHQEVRRGSPGLEHLS